MAADGEHVALAELADAVEADQGGEALAGEASSHFCRVREGTAEHTGPEKGCRERVSDAASYLGRQ